MKLKNLFALTFLPFFLHSARTEETAAIKEPEPPKAFVARGNEPFWSVRIEAKKLTLEQPDGEGISKLEIPLPEPVITPENTTYTTSLNDKPFKLVITGSVSRDSMSGMPHPYRVELTLGEFKQTGTGGDPAELLMGKWTVTLLEDKPVLKDAAPTLEFDATGRVFGLASCNRFFGGYKLTGEGLSFEPLAGTQMMCEEEKMNQEQLFHKLMGTVARFDLGEKGELILFADDTPVLTATRKLPSP